MIKQTEYSEISTCKISKNRAVVVSENSQGGYTIAQRMQVIDDDKIVNLFLKGAFVCKDLDTLKLLRDTLTQAIDIEEAKIDEEWDDE